MWLSILPPPVGSGCRQMSVAAGGRSSGRASSPTRARPSAVCRVTGSRRAGRIVLARISVICSSAEVSRPGAGPPWPALPARIVPVPPSLGLIGLLRPHHDVRDARLDLLVAARAPVGLGGRRAGHLADHPVTVRPGLNLRRPPPGGRLLPRPAPRPSWPDPGPPPAGWPALPPSRGPPQVPGWPRGGDCWAAQRGGGGPCG